MTAQKIVFICQFVVWALLSSAHAQQGNLPKPAQKLPAYPPATCVTTDWRPESCEDRNANSIGKTKPQAQPSAAQLLDGLKCLKKTAKTLTEREPCKMRDTPSKDTPGYNYMNWLDDVFPPVVINHDEGGVIRFYVERYKLLKDRYFIIDGDCSSACTLVLAKSPDLICATERGWFNFRASRDNKTGASRPDGDAILMAAYPKEVKDWIASRGGLTNEWIGAHAQKFLPKCKEAESP